jgi:hypothetical protein
VDVTVQTPSLQSVWLVQGVPLFLRADSFWMTPDHLSLGTALAGVTHVQAGALWRSVGGAHVCAMFMRDGSEGVSGSLLVLKAQVPTGLRR